MEYYSYRSDLYLLRSDTRTETHEKQRTIQIGQINANIQCRSNFAECLHI